jgi:hypothetical protein
MDRGTALLISKAMLLLALIGAALPAQQKLLEPEYNNVPMYLGQDGSLKSLERGTGEIHTSIRALGYGGFNGYYIYKGAHSPEQLDADHLAFVVRLKNDGDDPTSAFRLTALESKKEARRVINSKLRVIGGAKSSIAEHQIPINIVKYGPNSFKITPEQKLAPGEYVFNPGINAAAGQTVTGFLFGIH